MNIPTPEQLRKENAIKRNVYLKECYEESRSLLIHWIEECYNEDVGSVKKWPFNSTSYAKRYNRDETDVNRRFGEVWRDAELSNKLREEFSAKGWRIELKEESQGYTFNLSWNNII